MAASSHSFRSKWLAWAPPDPTAPDHSTTATPLFEKTEGVSLSGTDKTAKTQTTEAEVSLSGTDKTDTSPSGSFVSAQQTRPREKTSRQSRPTPTPQELDAQLHDSAAEVLVYDLLADACLDVSEEPVQVYSDILHESFYLCRSQAQTLPLLAAGHVAYLPVEIRIFRLWQVKWPERFPDLFRRVHQAKKALGLVLVES